MKTTSLIIGMIGVIGLLGVIGYFKSTSSVFSGESPRIEILPKTYDFGTASYGSVLKYQFELKNTGKRTLEIKRVSTSCGCTTAKVSKNELASGEIETIDVAYDSAAMGSLHGKGPQERTIYIKSNDPKTPQTEAKIYANIN